MLSGGDGNDHLDGGHGSDHVFGGTSDDRIRAADGVIDTIDGGSGTDGALVDSIDVVTNVEMKHTATTAAHRGSAVNRTSEHPAHWVSAFLFRARGIEPLQYWKWRTPTMRCLEQPSPGNTRRFTNVMSFVNIACEYWYQTVSRLRSIIAPGFLIRRSTGTTLRLDIRATRGNFRLCLPDRVRH